MGGVTLAATPVARCTLRGAGTRNRSPSPRDANPSKGRGTRLAVLCLAVVVPAAAAAMLLLTQVPEPPPAAANGGDDRSSPPVRSSPTSARSAGNSIAPLPSPTVAPPPAEQAAVRQECKGTASRASALLANHLTIGRHAQVTLPADPRWNENPLESRNWEYSYQTLRFVLDLLAAGRQTGGERYLDRATFLLRDWVRDNPPNAGRSPFSWNDHSTAWRAEVLVCAAEVLPRAAWLDDALAVHAAKLAAPSFYSGEGNHALNQNIALLDIGCRLSHPEWSDLARRRLAALVVESVDAQGVTNEQSVFYQKYNWQNYSRAKRRLEDCGIKPPPELARIDRMPGFLAHATLPNGEYVTLGDTGRAKAMSVPGTTAEFAATGGRSGKHPTAVFAKYSAGYIFGRSGWGDDRRFADESAWSLRFGAGMQLHGHADGGSVTLYAAGARLLQEAGIFTLNHDRWRQFAIGRTANNVVAVDGRVFDAKRPTTLLRSSTGATGDEALVRSTGYAGVDVTRRVVYSRALGYLVVEDRLTSRTPIVARQLWHLSETARPTVDGTSVGSKSSSPHVRIIQLVETRKPAIVKGQTSPIQGWISFYTDHRTPAPTIEVASAGRAVRYITLVAPAASSDASIGVRAVAVTADGFSFVVTIDGHAERVTATQSGTTIEPID
jgi:Heparinase II/III-like protein/Heparinase II/III N-terminus